MWLIWCPDWFHLNGTLALIQIGNFHTGGPQSIDFLLPLLLFEFKVILHLLPEETRGTAITPAMCKIN